MWWQQLKQMNLKQIEEYKEILKNKIAATASIVLDYELNWVDKQGECGPQNIFKHLHMLIIKSYIKRFVIK